MYAHSIQERLLRSIAQEENVVDGLAKCGVDLLDMVKAGGVVLCFADRYVTVGEAPHEAEVKHLVEWPGLQNDKEVFYTNALPGIYAAAKRYKDIACGLLAISVLPGNRILWFRPEVSQVTFTDENHNTIMAGYSEALPWQPGEIAAARVLRNALVERLLNDL